MSRQGLVKTLVDDLMHVRPAPGSRWVALRASTTVLLALSILAGLYHLELAAYAAFGAFASVYGGPERTATRWRVQSLLAALLTTAVLSGPAVVTFDARRWWAIRCSRGLATAAGLAPLLGNGRRGGPVVGRSSAGAARPGAAPDRGTAAGLVLAALLLASGPLPAVFLVLVVTALQAAAELLVARHYGVALVFITPLALLLTQVAAPMPAGDLLESRSVETMFGVAVGLVLAALTRPWPTLRSRSARGAG